MTIERDLIAALVADIAAAHDESLDGFHAASRETMLGAMQAGNAFLAAPVAPVGQSHAVSYMEGISDGRAEVAKLVPLTDADIEDGSALYMVDDFMDFNAGVKFAERRHGIKP